MTPSPPSRPPKDRSWYYVLVHGTEITTYVAERNLAPDTSDEAVLHPEIDTHFEGIAGGRYIARKKEN
ncbi:MAG: hemimethylated DNA-binding YccV-like domain-containing protein [Rhodospirillales bacterium]|nr:hemimethylated DNA-binding YccV-like domain-containing protein [Rhodospirillales bacterium]